MASASSPVGAPPALGAMIFQKQRVVPVAAAVVADRRRGSPRARWRDLRSRCLDGLRLEAGVAGEGLVEVVHVGLVMPAVVDLHRQRVDVRFERVLGVGQGGEGVAMVVSPSWGSASRGTLVIGVSPTRTKLAAGRPGSAPQVGGPAGPGRGCGVGRARPASAAALDPRLLGNHRLGDRPLRCRSERRAPRGDQGSQRCTPPSSSLWKTVMWWSVISPALGEEGVLGPSYAGTAGSGRPWPGRRHPGGSAVRRHADAGTGGGFPEGVRE